MKQILTLAVMLILMVTAVSAVEIIEYSDFQCPFCKRGFDTMEALEDIYGDDIEITFKHFPLSFHNHAFKAAEAAECARDQGNFEDYIEELFNNQDALDVDSLKQYAVEFGFDTEQFNACLDSDFKASKVNADISEGQKKGVSGTPAFFVNGEKVVGAYPLEHFIDIIDEHLGVSSDSCLVSDTLEEGETNTYSVEGEEYEVEVIIITDNGQVKFMINGELTNSMEEGDSYKTSDGRKIEVKDVLTSYSSEDMVEFCFVGLSGDGESQVVVDDCTDSDGGKNVFEVGKTTGKNAYGNMGTSVDYCMSKEYVMEKSCSGDEVISTQEKCPAGYECVNKDSKGGHEGACVKVESSRCSDSDGGKDYYEKGTVKTRDEVVTDFCKGKYTLVEGTCDEAGGKVYEYNCPVSCKKGACVRDVVEEEYEEIPEEDEYEPVQPVNPKCSGCLKDKICLPFGTRVMDNGQAVFCSIGNGFEKQNPDNAVCQNDYECVSNSCSSGKCIDLEKEIRETKNIVEKILNWLSKLFG